MAVGASALWGLSGNVAQLLFERYHFAAPWLVNMRLICAGLLCLGFGCATRGPSAALSVLRDRRDRYRILAYAIFGMLAVQYTFFSCIKAGNAAAATLLQYACPVFLVAWGLLRHLRPPTAREALACTLALPGIALLVTNGRTDSLAVPPAAVVWGLASAVAAAFYIGYPSALIARHGAPNVTGWGMLLGGLALLPFARPWRESGAVFTPISILAMAFVIVFGTFVAFVLYLSSLKHISPTEASVVASAEPLTATAVAVLALGVHFGAWQGVGAILVLATVLSLSVL